MPDSANRHPKTRIGSRCPESSRGPAVESTVLAAGKPLDITLEIAPSRVRSSPSLQFRSRAPLTPYRDCLYWSFPTTAGFGPQSGRGCATSTSDLSRAGRTLFPKGPGTSTTAGASRDLDFDQKGVEPAMKTHICFIAEASTCVMHPNRPERILIRRSRRMKRGRTRVGSPRDRVHAARDRRSTRIECRFGDPMTRSLKDPRIESTALAEFGRTPACRRAGFVCHWIRPSGTRR